MRSELERLCDRMGVTVECAHGKNKEECTWENFDGHSWRVTLKYQRRQLSVDFFTGRGIEREPTAGDVLSCLLTDASCEGQSFEDWCSEFGYDTDSRKAEKTFKACEAMVPKLRRFLGADYDKFRNAEH